MKPTPSLLSIVTPAYKEADNLPLLYKSICKVLDAMHQEWEWIVVDDHSSDETFGVIQQIFKRDSRVRGIRLSRNSGSHIAISCGLHNASGNCVIIMAADLQDPPEALPELLLRWQDSTQVVWAVRRQREGEKTSTIGFARLYYFIMRYLVGIREMPATGADFFLLDRQVVDAFCQFSESNISIFALITWMGFRQATITYDKRPRLHGHSSWSIGKKIKLVIDSVVSFSYLPIRLMSFLGFFVALLGFLYACLAIFNAIRGLPSTGWASLMTAILILGGIQMLMMGMLGEYLWRTLGEARHRPTYFIEAMINVQPRMKRENL